MSNPLAKKSVRRTEKNMAQGLEVRFVISDDYREGPQIWQYTEPDDQDSDGDPIDNDNEEDETVYAVTFPPLRPWVVSVFEVAMDEDGTGESRLLEVFINQEDALRYCEIQYQRYSGDAPFKHDGTHSSSYHPNGKRQRLEDPNAEDEDGHALKLEPPYSNEDLHWFIIMHPDGDWTARSLNPFSVW